MGPEVPCSTTGPVIAAARNRVGTLTALFMTGFGTFLNLYATQPLLPRFRQIFSTSEVMVSLTVTAPVLAVALMAPLVGLIADSVGRKRVIVTAMLGLALPTALAGTAGAYKCTPQDVQDGPAALPEIEPDAVGRADGRGGQRAVGVDFIGVRSFALDDALRVGDRGLARREMNYDLRGVPGPDHDAGDRNAVVAVGRVKGG